MMLTISHIRRGSPGKKAYLDANADCVAVGASVFHIDAAGRKLGVLRYSGDAHGDARRIPSGEPYLMHPFLMVRRSAMNSVGGYRYAFHSEDTDLYWRLKHLGRLHNLEDILGEYRLHAGSVSSKSVLNGRICAVNSQLAAISSVRRSDCRRDIVFDAELLKSYEEAESLDKIVAIASRQLDADERRYLLMATAAKMIELRMYRSFRLTKDDRAFVTQTLFSNRSLLDRATTRRLIGQILHLLRPKFGLRRIAHQIFHRN
jgi:hypothetical protein